MTLFITFYSIRHFSLTTVSMVNGTTAFVTLFLGWFILKEQVTVRNFAILAFGFVGTGIVIFGHSHHSTAARGGFYSLLLLLTNPFIIATGAISMR